MVNQKQKEKKKKEHERVAKARVISRRTSLRKYRKLGEEQQIKEKEAQDIMQGRPTPFIKDPVKQAERDSARARVVSDKLQQNLKILEALESEYEAEQSTRAEMNQNLESEGHNTMREKMDALHKKALEVTGKAALLAEAEKEYALQENKSIGQQSIEEEIVVEPTISSQ